MEGNASALHGKQQCSGMLALRASVAHVSTSWYVSPACKGAQEREGKHCFEPLVQVHRCYMYTQNIVCVCVCVCVYVSVHVCVSTHACLRVCVHVHCISKHAYERQY